MWNMRDSKDDFSSASVEVSLRLYICLTIQYMISNWEHKTCTICKSK